MPHSRKITAQSSRLRSELAAPLDETALFTLTAADLDAACHTSDVAGAVLGAPASPSQDDRK